MAACARSPLLKEHWLPHPFFHILQNLSKCYNTSWDGNKAFFNSFESTNDKVRSDSKGWQQRWQGIFMPYFFFFYGAVFAASVIKKQGCSRSSNFHGSHNVAPHLKIVCHYELSALLSASLPFKVCRISTSQLRFFFFFLDLCVSLRATWLFFWCDLILYSKCCILLRAHAGREKQLGFGNVSP